MPPRFKYLLAGATSSGIGDGLVQVALPLLLTTRGEPAAVVTAVAAAQAIPWLLIGLHAGALVDRVPLGRLLALVDLGRAGFAAALTFAVITDQSVVAWAYLTAVAMGAGDAVVTAGLDTATTRLVDPDRFEQANGRMFTVITGTQHLLGPAIGGVLFRAANALPFGINAASYVLSAACFRRADPPDLSDPPARRRIGTDIAEGVRWFATSRPLRRLAAVLLVFSATQAAVMASLALLVIRRYHADEATLGLVLAVGAVGNALGAWRSGPIIGRLGIRTVLLGGGTIVGGTYVLLGATTSPVTAAVAMLIEGAVIGIAHVGLTSLRQRIVPPEMMGRVSSLIRIAIWGIAPLASIGVGVAAHHVGPGVAVVTVGAIQMAAAAVLPIPTVAPPEPRPAVPSGSAEQ